MLTTYLCGRYVYRQRLQTVRDVYIGARGLYLPDAYYAWAGRTPQVKLQFGTPVMLKFKIGPGNTTYFYPWAVYVPVPTGCEKEAALIVERYSGKA